MSANALRVLVCCVAWLFVAGCPDSSKKNPDPPVDATSDAVDAVDAPDDTQVDVDATPPPEPLGYLHPLSPVEATDLNDSLTVIRVDLVASTTTHETPDGPVAGYAYNDQTPGPTIRGKLGDTLEVHLTNNLLVPTTIHWHGAHVPWAMDGVTWKQDPVSPGETFVYTFPLIRGGTFWYHPHFDTDSQVDLGLYSVLIVEDPAEPKADHELVLVFDSFEESDHEESSVHTHVHGDTIIRDWLVNGEQKPEIAFPAGTTVRVRMLNASNSGYLDLEWPDIRQIGADQGLLAGLEQPDRLLLGPGDRVEVEWLVDATGFTALAHPHTLLGGLAYGDPVAAFTVVGQGEEPAPEGLDWSWSEAPPSADPGSTDVVYVFSGSPHTGEWMVNAELYPEVTVETIPAGKTFVMEVRNLSPSLHPFHMHGVNFEVLSINGKAPARRTIDDTLNLNVYDVVRLLVTNDNPGEWMVHCHILGHAHNGMMTVIQFD